MTAVFAGNDFMALGVLHALHESGRRVPDDVSVVGFDDVPEAAYYWPALTTVAQDFSELGRRAVTVALAAVAGRSRPRRPHRAGPEVRPRPGPVAPDRRRSHARVECLLTITSVPLATSAAATRELT